MTLLPAVRPVRRAYVGYLANPYDALSSVTWFEIPNTTIRLATLRWGAQHELARVEPSYASLVLDNTDGAYEPTNPFGFGYPNLRPGNRLRIIDTWAGVPYIRFTGYISSWPRSWTGVGQASVTIEAYDALGAVLNAVDIPASPFEMETRRIIERVPANGKAVWARLNESTGALVAVDSSGMGLDGSYQGAPTLGVDGLGADGDKAAEFPSNARASFPYKNLITQFPWSAHWLMRTSVNRAYDKVVFYAADLPNNPTQYIEVFVDDTGGPTPGGIFALVRAGSAIVRAINTTVTVDDSFPHRVALVCASPTDFRIYVDNTDRTAVYNAGTAGIPNDLGTGYAIGNTPAVAFGDFPFTITPGTDVLDEVLILDGYELTAYDIGRLNAASASNVLLTPKSGQRAAAVLEAVGWPLADMAVDDGLSSVQAGYVAGKAVDYLQQLSLTEGGRLFVDGAGVITFHDRHRILQPPYTVSQMTFGDPAAGEIGYVPVLTYGEDDADIWNDVPVGNAGQDVQVARDKASKDLYGWKTLTGLTGLLGTSEQEARDRANRDLSLYKDPVTRIRSITVKPQEDAAQGTAVWSALLSLGQNSRVTVKAQPPGAPLFTQQSHVEHLEETVTPTDWSVTLRLSAAETQEYWLLGTSALGSGTRLAY